MLWLLLSLSLSTIAADTTSSRHLRKGENSRGEGAAINQSIKQRTNKQSRHSMLWLLLSLSLSTTAADTTSSRHLRKGENSRGEGAAINQSIKQQTNKQSMHNSYLLLPIHQSPR
jgi:hypothetical protein